MPTETELKARVADLAELRATLCLRGAVLVQPRGLEDNYLFDDQQWQLSQQGQALRVRLSHDRVILTFKGARTITSGVKSREELEVDCNDGQTLLMLLERLGYQRAFRYQKYRETWHLDGVEVMLDETPIGQFAEIEGTEPAVRVVATQLGLTASVVPESYATLFRQALLAQGLATDAMLFASEADDARP